MSGFFVTGFKPSKRCRVEGRDELSFRVQCAGNRLGNIGKFELTG
jgi:hypothetical protein